jgi:hypothetical protein
MNHNDVFLIGVISAQDDDGTIHEAFCYTTNAPTNLWVGAICNDGSRMDVRFLGYFLNQLIEADAFNEGDFVMDRNQDGVKLTAIVGSEVPARSVDAFQAQTDTVRKVSIHVGE